MKTSISILFIFIFSATCLAQGTKLENPNKAIMKDAPINYTGDEYILQSNNESSNFSPKIQSDLEILIGESRYDLQTNGSINHRLSRTEDEKMYGVWTMGFQSTTGFPDRGTGYNTFDGTQWGDLPTQPLEESIRTGWPNYARTDAGHEIVVNHVFTEGEYRLHYLRRENGSTDWIEGDIPTETPFGALWPTVVVGGENGESIHVLAITNPIALSGQPYKGVDSHPLYYRSQDAGLTWDIVDGIIPGLDSTSLKTVFRADAYNIDASGDIVSIALFDPFNDVMLLKSTDNGSSWEKTIVNDFPIDKFEVDVGYEIDSIPYDEDTYPVQGSMFTADGGGAVLIDDNGDTHLFFGRMFVSDLDTLDGVWQFFPFTSGIAYWKEGNAPNKFDIIADIEDLNGDGVIDLPNGVGSYGVSGLTSQVSPGIDKDGNLYIAYVAVMEGADYIDIQDNQHYRNIYLTTSDDNGDNWSIPFNVINEETVGGSQFVFFIEAVFPHMARYVDDQVHLIYQQDFRPGLAVVGDMDGFEPNMIKYVGVDITDLETSTLEVEDKPGFSIIPNPSRSETTIIIDTQKFGISVLNIYNSSGLLMKTIELPTNTRALTIPIDELSNGIYFLELNNGNHVVSQRLVKM